MELERKSHSLDPVRKALQDFEEALTAREKWSMVESKVMKQQEVDRTRERILDEIMTLVRKTLADRAAP